MEVIFDLDTEAAATAAELGLPFARAATAGVHPAFVAGLVDLMRGAGRRGPRRGTRTEPVVDGDGPVGWYECRPTAVRTCANRAGRPSCQARESEPRDRIARSDREFCRSGAL